MSLRHTAGIGWRHPHYAAVLEQRPDVGFLQVHSENFFGADLSAANAVVLPGGAALATLEAARAHYPISLHGVGLSLGSALGIDDQHLDQLAALVQRIEPVRVSDHACFARGWRTTAQGQQLVHASDLLPIPFTHTSLQVLCANVQRVQDRLQRPLLVENLSAYVQYEAADFSEAQFLSELTARTGCQLLLDVNNVFVNMLNAQRLEDTSASLNRPLAVHNGIAFLNALPAQAVGEMHVAGHCELPDIVIDDHGSAVCDEVWQLYAHAVKRFGDAPALVEWDTAIPELDILLVQAKLADAHAAKALA
jgi:uncharacterized protein